MKKLCALLALLLLLWDAPALPAVKAASAETPDWSEPILDEPEEDIRDQRDLPFLEPGEAPIVTETSYFSEYVAIQITARRLEVKVNDRETHKSDVYIADIWVKTFECFLRAFPGEKWRSTKQTLTQLSESNGAILAMSGDSANNLAKGWEIINGEVMRDGTMSVNRTRDVGILYQNGKLVTLDARTFDSQAIKEAAERGEIWQLFLFGPMLLDENGHAMDRFNSKVTPINPRSAIGYYEPGHYCFVQVDGRQTPSKLEPGEKNWGVTLKTLSRLMEELGCKTAYNLDGGKTSQMYFNGQVISSPQGGGRLLGDILLVKEP